MDRALRCLLLGLALSFLSCLTTVEPSYTTAKGDSLITSQFTIDPDTHKLKPSPTPILTTTVFVPSNMPSASILLQADGTFAPVVTSFLFPQPIAKVFIEVESMDSGSVPFLASNEALIDWHHSALPLPHSFNVIGGPLLPPGAYTVRLMAVAVPADDGNLYPFVVTKETSLAVVRPRVGPIEQMTLAEDSEPNNFHGTKDLPACVLDAVHFGFEPRLSPPGLVATLPDDQLVHVPLEGLIHKGPFVPKQPWIVLASGNFFMPDLSLIGDGMWGLFVDGVHCGDQYSTWTVNDMQPNAETMAPMFVHGYFDQLPCRPTPKVCRSCPPTEIPDPSLLECQSGLTPGQSGTHEVTLDATKFPFHPAHSPKDPVNRVVYSVMGSKNGAGGARMLFMSGRTEVQGSARLGKDVNSALDSKLMKPLGTPIALATAKIPIPAKHNGVVFFTAKTRNMGMENSESGSYKLWIEIREGDVSNPCDKSVDPFLKSPTAVQWTSNDSQRTLGVSLLTTGLKRLVAEKTFTVSACGQADANPDDPRPPFDHPVLTADVPLIWFDGDGANQ